MLTLRCFLGQQKLILFCSVLEPFSKHYFVVRPISLVVPSLSTSFLFFYFYFSISHFYYTSKSIEHWSHKILRIYRALLEDISSLLRVRGESINNEKLWAIQLAEPYEKFFHVPHIKKGCRSSQHVGDFQSCRTSFGDSYVDLFSLFWALTNNWACLFYAHWQVTQFSSSRLNAFVCN